MNKTLLNKVRCLLISSGLEKNFLGEALVSACYLVNRSLNRVLNLKTPYEMLLGKVPSLSFLKVFGCTAYAHKKEDKLNPRAIKCIFLGYPTGVKGYRLCTFENGRPKIVIFRDVIFNEHEFVHLKAEKGMFSECA